MHSHYTDILWCTVTILIYSDTRSLYWYTLIHGHYTDILWCTVTILIYSDARSLYWYTLIHGYYPDILWCTITILMHGQQNIKFHRNCLQAFPSTFHNYFMTSTIYGWNFNLFSSNLFVANNFKFKNCAGCGVGCMGPIEGVVHSTPK
jgi:hypothetical protein